MNDLIDPLQIRPVNNPIDSVISVPGSKSITNRALVLAALARGKSFLSGVLFSDDSRRLIQCLHHLGLAVPPDENLKTVSVEGLGKGPKATEKMPALFVGNAGTAARFLPPLVALGEGRFIFTAEPRMSARPMGELLTILEKQGAKIIPKPSTSGEEIFFVPGSTAKAYPFELIAAGLKGGEISVDISESSQFASGLLMAGPYMKAPLTLKVTGDRKEIPYIDMTAEMMRQFGAEARSEGGIFRVARGAYQAREYRIEPDVSGACYFFAAGALLGGRVTVKGLSRQSMQGDIRFLGLLKHMGCQFFEDEDLGGLTLEHGPGLGLRGVDVDMNAFSDQALTLAAMAPFCSSPVTIRNVGHIRKQESDRLEAISINLRALGARAEILPSGDGIQIQPAAPGELHGAEIETFNDHRVAMAFSLVGLRVPGVKIKNPSCVKKTFENYWQVFGELQGGHA